MKRNSRKGIPNGAEKWMLGRKLSEETKKKMSLSRLGSKNHQWKGDDAGYSALHYWARDNVPNSLTDRCNKCKKIKPLDIANISGKYLRRIEDWEWLCRKCHLLSEGRMKNLACNFPPEIRSKIAKKSWVTRKELPLVANAVPRVTK